MNVAGRFPNWIEPFDRWHGLMLPPILIVLVLLIWTLPDSQVRQRSRARPPSLPVPATLAGPPSAVPTPAVPAAVPRALRPTRIESPFPNALFWRDRLGDVEGVAEPGSAVSLFLGDKLLSVGTADSEGRYRFRLANFPPGLHRLQVIASLGDTSKASEPVQFTVKAEKSPGPSKPAKSSKPSKPSKPAPKAKPPAKKPASNKP